MRAAYLLVVGVLVLALAQQGQSQFRQPFGGGGGGGALKDPNQFFEIMAKGRPYIVISETRMMREPLMQYAKEKGITNDQISREQFVSFYAKMDQYRGKSDVPGGSMKGGFSPSSGGGPSAMTITPSAPGVIPAPGQNPLEAISQWAEADFKRRDQNGDGQLNQDEMTGNLREQIERWDTNRDGMISMDEYKVYFSARLQMRDGGGPDSAPSNPITILIEEDYDRRPNVIRAGKLPKELPKWFSDLDADKDAQVALFEWHKGGKNLEEFKDWDRNDDGLITAEEVLAKLKGVTATASTNSPSGSSPPSFGMRGSGEGRPGGPGEGGGRPSFGGGPPGNFGGPGSGGFGGFKKRDR